VTIALDGSVIVPAAPVVAREAPAAGATELLTPNERDYDRLDPQLRIVGV
jgi:hypothetical protein